MACGGVTDFYYSLSDRERQVCQWPQALVSCGFQPDAKAVWSSCAAVADDSVTPMQRKRPAWRAAPPPRVSVTCRDAASQAALRAARGSAGAIPPRLQRCYTGHAYITCAHAGAARRNGYAGLARTRGDAQRAGADCCAGAGDWPAPLAPAPEMGLGPGWLRSQPPQASRLSPSSKMTASGRPGIVRVTVAPFAVVAAQMPRHRRGQACLFLL